MDLFNFIKDHVDILSVIGEYTSLKKTGSMYWKAPCPFHHENTPSFTVSPHKKIFYCFGCHATGDVIEFIGKIEHLNPFESAQRLAERYQLQIPENLQKTVHLKFDKTYQQLCSAVAVWCSNMLQKNIQAQQYLKSRNISSLTCARFNVGYFPAGSRAVSQLLAYVTPLGFSSQDLINANILMQGKQGLYSPFQNRIMFAIRDHLGAVCGFGGRVFLPEDTGPKYYNSKESEHFKKGKILFGLDLAKAEIQKQQSVFVVEGYMDCIALSQSGYHNVVATLGTACSIDHLQQLAKHTQRIYLLYDADKAGQQAIIRLTALCWQLDLDVKVVCLPPGHDPASMLEQKLDIGLYIDKARDIFDFFVTIKTENFAQNSMKNKMAVVAEMFDLIVQVKDGLKQNILLMKMSERVQIPLEIIKKEYTIRYNQGYSKQQEQFNQEPSPIDMTDQEQLEEQIIAILMHEPELMNEKYHMLLTAAVSSQSAHILEIVEQKRKMQQKVEIQDLTLILSASELQRYKAAIFSIESSNLKQTLHSLMIKFQKKYWKSLASHIKIKIIQAQKIGNSQEVVRLMSLFEELKVEFI